MKLRNAPDFAEKAAQWFSDKWGIPFEVYLDSMHECIAQKSSIPQWYIVMGNDGQIIGGAGVIENDFHDRKDLSPNVCALFVEEEHRNQGIAKHILRSIQNDIENMGVHALYLVTDIVGFYEKSSWSFRGMVNGDDGAAMRMYVSSSLSV